MGLAAGINFSLRSVALAGASYRRDHQEQPLKPDEILQMFGRAGRRGLDETGFVLVTANELRLLDAHAGHLSRSAAVDWSALLNLMTLAARNQRDPFREAVRVQERLFTTKPIVLGVEESLKHPDVPCGLKTDAERSRHVRHQVREMLNSRGEWERVGAPVERPVREISVMSTVVETTPATAGGELRVAAPELRSILTEPDALEKVGTGSLCVLAEETDALAPDLATKRQTYGRALTVADRLNDDRVIIAKWVRRLTNWNGRQASLQVWTNQIAPLVETKLAQQKTPVVRFVNRAQRIVAHVSIADLTLRVPVDKHGVALWRPPTREVLADDCARCSLVEVCRHLPTTTGTALLWRRLGLVDAGGVPTRRGQIVSFCSHGDGLAVAAALEDASYPLDELIYDLANLDAGFRFCGEENRWAGRLALACHQQFGQQSIPGYLENGTPPKYGSGAEQVVASVHKNPLTKQAWITDLVGAGDIDRIIIEWRSLLRQIVQAPELDWPRWRALQALARSILNDTESPTVTDLPPLEYHQTRRVEHRLRLRNR